MNELIGNSKIYALAKEAGLIEFEQFAWNPELGSPTYESVAKARKFAELIVAECYEAIKKDMELAHIQLIPIDFGIYANGRLRRIIKEHFGVEE